MCSRNSDKFLVPDLVTEAFGNFPAHVPSRLADVGTRALAPLVGPYAWAWKCGRQNSVALDSFLAVSRWVDDGVPFPGEAFR